MDEAEIYFVAQAMKAKRDELSRCRLSQIWPDLARAALTARDEYRAAHAPTRRSDGESIPLGGLDRLRKS
jgi:hypothetical protein